MGATTFDQALFLAIFLASFHVHAILSGSLAVMCLSDCLVYFFFFAEGSTQKPLLRCVILSSPSSGYPQSIFTFYAYGTFDLLIIKITKELLIITILNSIFSGDAYILDTATMSWFQLRVPLIQRLDQFTGTNNINL